MSTKLGCGDTARNQVRSPIAKILFVEGSAEIAGL